MTDQFLVKDDDARLIVASAFLRMLLGARTGFVMEMWRDYVAEPVRLLRFWEEAFPPCLHSWGQERLECSPQNGGAFPYG